MNPRYPVFIPTKGRWNNLYTMRAFWRCGIPFYAVVEPQQLDDYRRAFDAEGIKPVEILVTPHRDEGLVPTRNFVWDFASAMGAERFWTFDDNIRGLFRYNRNLLVPCGDGTPLAVVEDFTERYDNVVISGMNYFMFVSRKCLYPPFYFNARVYSNMLLWTDYPDPRGFAYRNEMKRYNDDTDLNLRVLKDGNCTILFNAFLIDKLATMVVKGGMGYTRDENDREKDSRYQATLELKEKHPDVTTITRKWGRWHHHVNYEPFRKNRLISRPGTDEIPEGENEFGLQLEVNGEIVPKEIGLGREFLAKEADAKAAARKERARERGKEIRRRRPQQAPATEPVPAEVSPEERAAILERSRSACDRVRDTELRRKEGFD